MPSESAPAAGAAVNDLEIRVVGMSRSGNHAIVDWILAQATGPTCFLNCAEAGTNPFETARPLADGEPGYRIDYGPFDVERERRGQFSRKRLLLHSYEDTFLRRLNDAARAQPDVGASARQVDLLILRDPFNLFASRLQSGFGHVDARTAQRIWCAHAREFLALRRNLRPGAVKVTYNAWVDDPLYRRRLARDLGLRFDDAAVRQVARTGGGSSFDARVFDGRAHEMGVHERWRRYVGDARYRDIFTEELLDLSERIFGRLPAHDAVTGAGQDAASRVRVA